MSSVLNRLLNITKAAAHELLDKLEDPVRMMDYYVKNAAEEIERLKAEIAKQKGTERWLETRLEELRQQTAQAEERAAEAVTGGREAEARLALEAKLHYMEKADETARQLDAARAAVAELERRLETAKAAHASMQARHGELAERARKAAAQVRYAGCGSEALSGFERMEEKIMQWESRSELAAKRYAESGHAGSPAPDAAAARHARIEEELERLRQRKTE
ncbi:membrane protein [Paenibacillus cisolokensis]|uniref:Membrane protein n=1 Tax=Paenibacillus cisolokensis TaxID=1658519 RepID=A0ABQ4NFJ8_9BACL|nr:PspA/IM30 family protein [Paenibacillus cisolokensis]GIQ67020.1 membrane protein [Paenibacillus cisolokensis]